MRTLYVTDLDGTLLNRNERINQYSLDIINDLVEKGMLFTYATARSLVSASVILLVSYALYAEVMRENAYLSRTVEIQENQKVIDTGLYGVVRHPMYFATTLLFLSFPLVLGSGVAFVIFLFYPLILVKRIKNEEEVLEKGLEGYKEYKEKVKYRMIPFVW